MQKKLKQAFLCFMTLGLFFSRDTDAMQPRRKLRLPIPPGGKTPYKSSQPRKKLRLPIRPDDEIIRHSSDSDDGEIIYYERRPAREASPDRLARPRHIKDQCCGLISACRFKNNSEGRRKYIDLCYASKSRRFIDDLIFEYADVSCSSWLRCPHHVKLIKLLALEAIKRDDEETMHNLLESGFNKKTQLLDAEIDTKKQSLLRIAISYKAIGVIESLLEHGISITPADVFAAGEECPAVIERIKRSYDNQAGWYRGYLLIRSCCS